MKRNFKQIVSACLIGLLVTQSTYGVLPALADVGDAVPTSSAIVQSAARESGGSIGSWSQASASNEIKAVSFNDGQKTTWEPEEELTLKGTINVNPEILWNLASDSNAFGPDEISGYEAYVELFTVDTNGLIDEPKLTISKDKTFTITGTIPEDAAEMSYRIEIKLDGTSVGDFIDIEVKAAALSCPEFSFKPESLTLEEGESRSYELIITDLGEETEDTLAETITYTSSDPDIVEVTGNGSLKYGLTAKAAGTAVITAATSICDHKATMTVTVNPAVETYYKLTLVDGKVIRTSAGNIETMTFPAGAEIVLEANEAPVNKRITNSWDYTVNDVENHVDGNLFTMPTGDTTVKAQYRDALINIGLYSIAFDLNPESDSPKSQEIEMVCDFESYELEYDKTLIKVEEQWKDGNYVGLLVTPLDKTGVAELVAKSKDDLGNDVSSKVYVNISNSRTAFALKLKEGCNAYVMDDPDGTKLDLNKVPVGTMVYLWANKADQRVVRWTMDGETLELEQDDEGRYYILMPAKDTTIGAVFRDAKIVVKGTDMVTFDRNPEKNSPKEYTFELETDYDSWYVDYATEEGEAYLVDVDIDWESKKIIVTPWEDETGTVELLVGYVKDEGEEGDPISIVVSVIDSSVPAETPKTEGGNSEVKTDIIAEDVEVPAKVDGMSDEDHQKVAEETPVKAAEAIDSIKGNEAVTADGATSGFDQPEGLAQILEGRDPNLEYTIYPVQELKGVSMGVEAVPTGEKDEDGNDIMTYVPVVTRAEFEISAYVKPKDMKVQGEKLENIRGNFTLRIPVPVGVSSNAKYAHVYHNGEYSQDPVIEGTDPHRYVTIRTRSFSPFVLEFKPTRYSTGNSGGGSRGGGGGGSSTTTTTTGTWILDAIGWWYKNADGSYPYGTWANLYYSTNSYKWYHFNAQGYMETGWFTDVDGHRYYLHPVSDGTQGHMYTGWHQIDGNWYYFTETKTDANPTGSLLVNTTTPDGYTVDASGVWVQ